MQIRQGGVRIGLIVAAVALCAPAMAWTYFDYNSFSPGDIGPGNAWEVNDQAGYLALGPGVLRLVSQSAQNAAGSAWFHIPHDVTHGFDVSFEFQILDHTGGTNEGSGLAFVVQNRNGTSYIAYGEHANGYYTPDVGSPRLVAVEIDDYAYSIYGESYDHIGINVDDATDHSHAYQYSSNPWSGGATQWVRVIYDHSQTRLDVYYIDVGDPQIYGGASMPVMSRSLDLGAIIGQSGTTNGYLGFTACTRNNSADTRRASYQINRTSMTASAPPTDIDLSNASVDEEQAATMVGTLSTTDLDAADTHTYQITLDASGMFEILYGNELWTTGPIDYETMGSPLQIQITTTDNGRPTRLSYSELFDITIVDVNFPPTDIVLDPASPSVNEHSGAGIVMGTLDTVDESPVDMFAYSLVTGTGDTHNAYFEVLDPGSGWVLRTTQDLDYETLGGTLSVRIRSQEATTTEHYYIEEVFTITLIDGNDPPGDIIVPDPLQVGDDCLENDAVNTLMLEAATAGPSPYTWVMDDTAGGRFTLSSSTTLSVQILVTAIGEASIDASTPSHNVTVTVFNDYGLSRTESMTIYVLDRTPPTAWCKDATVTLGLAGTYTMQPSDVNNGSWDNVGVTSYEYYRKEGSAPYPLLGDVDCGDVASPVTVIFRVLDAEGNFGECESLVTVVNPGPTAVCQDATVQLDAAGTATLAPADVDGGSYARCGPLTLVSVSQDTFTCSDLGDVPVTLTVRDGHGLEDTCNATVTVTDLLGPNMACQDITVSLNAGGNANIVPEDVDDGSTDNCGTTTLTSVMPNMFTCANVGDNTVTLTGVDGYGNTATCEANVNIREETAPVASCQNFTVALDGTGNATITTANINNGSSDNCGTVLLDLSQTDFTCADAGANFVTLTVSDLSGNTDTCVSEVMVYENELPTAVCQDITITLSPAGEATITGADVDGGSTDNCGSALLDMTVVPGAFTCGELGDNAYVLTVADLSGNSDTCTGTVHVLENSGLAAVCQDITVQLDGAGSASIVPADVDDGSGTGCNPATLVSVVPDSFDCSNTGGNSVTLTVSDGASATDTCTANVFVEDAIVPTALCQNITVDLDGAGQATITAAQVDNGSSDNCAGMTLGVDPSSFTCADIGNNTVTLTATDASGNTATCTGTVTIRDATLPSALCQDITVDLDDLGQVTVAAAQVDGGSSDNCGTAILSLVPANFDCTHIGDNNVTLTVEDGNGNSATCAAVVTVQDITPPVAACRDVTVIIDASQTATLTAAEVDAGCTDNCPGLSVSIDVTLFDCDQEGTQVPVLLTAVDAAGNSDTCTGMAYVDDPDLHCIPSGLHFVEKPTGPIDKYVGESLLLHVLVAGGIGDITYEWYHDSELIAGADTNDYFVSEVALDVDDGWYYCCAEDEGGARRCFFPPVLVNVLEHHVEDVPVTGGAGLALFAFASALAGALTLRRRA